MPVMKPYDVYVDSQVKSFRDGKTVTLPTKSGRRIFTCTSQDGDKINPNPHSFTKQVYDYGYGITYTDTCYRGVYRPSGASGPIDTDAVSPLIQPSMCLAEISDRAMEKIYDKIKGNNNFVVDLAESSTTLRMLRGTLNLKRVALDFFTEVLSPRTTIGRRLPTKGQRRLDYMSAKWLEYRYGWSPLVSSIYDAMDTLGGEHLINGAYPVKGRASAKKTAHTRTGSGSADDPSVTTKTNLSVRIEYCYHFALDPSARIYDWTSLNPVGIAWELMPLSFVADWVVNISQQLSLWENYLLFNSRVKSGYRTLTSLQESHRNTSGVSKGLYYRWPNGSFMDGPYGDKVVQKDAYSRITSLDRALTKSLPLPGGIRLNVNFGSKRQLDAAALFHQIVAKRFR